MGKLIETTFDKALARQMSTMKPESQRPPYPLTPASKQSKQHPAGHNKGTLSWNQFREAFAKVLLALQNQKVRPQIHQPEGGGDRA